MVCFDCIILTFSLMTSKEQISISALEIHFEDKKKEYLPTENGQMTNIYNILKRKVKLGNFHETFQIIKKIYQNT